MCYRRWKTYNHALNKKMLRRRCKVPIDMLIIYLTEDGIVDLVVTLEVVGGSSIEYLLYMTMICKVGVERGKAYFIKH